MKNRRIGSAFLAFLLVMNVFCLSAFASAASAEDPGSPVVAIRALDSASGTFEVIVRSPDTTADAQVLIPVWAGEDQEDLSWYPAQRRGSEWAATVSIADHQWHLGLYTAHAYVSEKDTLTLLGGTSANLQLPHTGTLNCTADAEQTTIFASLTGIPLPEDSPVWFRAETNKGTAKNYPAVRNGSVFTAAIPVGDHKVSGEYTIEAFFGLPAILLASNTYVVDSLYAAQVVIDNPDGHKGTFQVVAEAGPVEHVAGMQAAVWHASDQSDLRWYDMEKAGDRYRAEISVANHEHAFGSYHVHVYATMTNGIMELLGGTTVNMEADNHLYARQTEQDVCTLYLLGPSRGQVRAAVWSAAQGQDDLLWYDMELGEDGIWKAQVSLEDHPGGRTCNVHAYLGDTFLASISFPESEAAGSSSLAADERLQRDAETVYGEIGRDLRAAYEFVSEKMSYVSREGHIVPPAGYTRQQWYAVEGFETLRGNCYTFASMFYELAKRLGYDAEYVEGEVPSVNGTWIGHGFVLITLDGQTYICDPVFQHSSTSGRNYYMQPVENPRTTYRW